MPPEQILKFKEFFGIEMAEPQKGVHFESEDLLSQIAEHIVQDQTTEQAVVRPDQQVLLNPYAEHEPTEVTGVTD